MASHESDVPQDESWIDIEIKEAMREIFPTKSGDLYKKAYDKLQAWIQTAHLEGSTTEKDVFAYLHQMLVAGRWKSPGTLWCKFSMLRSVILSEEGSTLKTQI